MKDGAEPLSLSFGPRGGGGTNGWASPAEKGPAGPLEKGPASLGN